MLAEWGFTHCRLPVEWARIEPEPGRLDHDAIDRYLDVLAAARDVGLEDVASTPEHHPAGVVCRR